MNPTHPVPTPSSSRKLIIRRIVITLTLLGTVGTLSSALLGKYFREFYHRKKATTSAKAALVAIEANDWKTACSHAVIAWREDPTAPETLRALARIASTQPSSAHQAVTFWDKLIETNQATDDDKIRAAQTLLSIGDADRAKLTLDTISPENTQFKKVSELTLTILRTQGQTKNANLLSTTIAQQSRTSPDPDIRLFGAMLGLASPPISPPDLTTDPDHQTLWDLSSRNDNIGLDAIKSLHSNTSQLTTAEKTRLRDLTLSHPLATDDLQFLAISLEIQLYPKQKNQIIKREIQNRINQPIASLSNFFQWMLSEQEDRTILQLITFDEAIKNASIFPQYLTALIRTDNWTELERVFTTHKTLPISQTQIQFIRNYLLRQKGASDTETAASLRSFYQLCQASNDYLLLYLAAQFAQEQNLPEIAKSGFEILLTNQTYQIPAIEALLTIAQHENNYADLLRIAKTAKTTFPSGKNISRKLAYLRLIGAQEIELARDATTTQTNLPASDLDNLITALYQYRINNLPQMSQTLTQINPEQLDAGPRCVFAGLLLRNNEIPRAYRILEKIPAILLTDQEKSFSSLPQ